MFLGFPEFGTTVYDDNSDVIGASDPRLPSACLGGGEGRFPPHLCSVRVPSPLENCEALILLLCRDYGSAYSPFWMAMLTYMLEFVDWAGLLREEDLGDGYKPFYLAAKHGGSNMYSILKEQRSDLIWSEEAPASRQTD